jgi:Flp pilus assembly CpaF family ATPase
LVHIAVTGAGQLEVITPLITSHSTLTIGDENKPEKGLAEKTPDVEAGTSTTISPRKRYSVLSSDSHIHHYARRPDVADFIRTAVEATGGETGVVVCGGTSLVAKVRTSVAKLSDERAVHKGTGAQGIHLHVEEYCF